MPWSLDRHNRQTREGGAIEAVVKGEEAEVMVGRMGSDNEIGEDAARAAVLVCPAAGYILLKGAARRAPDGFSESPIHRNARLLAERIEKRFCSGGSGKEFREDRCGNHQTPSSQRSVQG